MSFDIILPFVRPIAALIQDPAVSEVMVNPSGRVFVERSGLVEEVPGVGVEERNLRVAVKNSARTLGDDISEERSILDAPAGWLAGGRGLSALQPRRPDAHDPQVPDAILYGRGARAQRHGAGRGPRPAPGRRLRAGTTS
jgi:hypothetical protein